LIAIDALIAVCAGEINTLQGNLNWIASRQNELEHPVWAGREGQLLPLCNAAESDSANLDHVAELLVRTGFDPQESLMLLVPEAFRNHPDLMKEYPEVRGRYMTCYMMCYMVFSCRSCPGAVLLACKLRRADSNSESLAQHGSCSFLRVWLVRASCRPRQPGQPCCYVMSILCYLLHT
jgi:hypothetical protein